MRRATTNRRGGRAEQGQRKRGGDGRKRGWQGKTGNKRTPDEAQPLREARKGGRRKGHSLNEITQEHKKRLERVGGQTKRTPAKGVERGR